MPARRHIKLYVDPSLRYTPQIAGTLSDHGPKLSICHTEQCTCGTGSQTTEQLLQSCPLYELLRKGIWPDHTPLARKFYGSRGGPTMYWHLHRGHWIEFPSDEREEEEDEEVTTKQQRRPRVFRMGLFSPPCRRLRCTAIAIPVI